MNYNDYFDEQTVLRKIAEDEFLEWVNNLFDIEKDGEYELNLSNVDVQMMKKGWMAAKGF